jgi:tetratricopeptide (TPR) repeat protein
MRQLFITLTIILFYSCTYNQKAKDYNNRGNTKIDLKDYTGAILDYNKAIELDPDNANAYYNRGCTKSSLEDFRGAMLDYNKAIKLDPDNAKAYYNRGIAKINLGRKESGCMDLSKAGGLGVFDAYDAIRYYCK